MAVYRDTTTSRVLTTSELFRKWVSMIHKGLKEVGLVQTSDTGQINPETVELPSTSSTAGYEIWRFNDSNQGNDPIFFKIEYGLGTTTSRPRLLVTFGSGSNGSGTITGASAGLFGASPSNTASGTPEFHVCHVDGALVFLESSVEAHTVLNSHFFICERQRDSKGAVITSGEFQGWTILSSSTGGTARSLVRRGGTEVESPTTILGSGTETSPEGRVLLAVLIPLNSNHFISAAAGLSSKFAKGEEGKITLYGVERTYRVVEGLISEGRHALGGANLGVAHQFLLLNE